MKYRNDVYYQKSVIAEREVVDLCETLRTAAMETVAGHSRSLIHFYEIELNGDFHVVFL